MTIAIGIVSVALAIALLVGREWRAQNRLLLALFYMRHDAPNGVYGMVLARVTGASRATLYVRLHFLCERGLIERVHAAFAVGWSEGARIRYRITDVGARYATANLLAEVLG